MDERNHGLLPDDMARELENIGYDSTLYTSNREGIVQVRGHHKTESEDEMMFGKEFGMTADEAERRFSEFVDEFIKIKEEKEKLQSRLEETGETDTEGIKDRLYEIQIRLSFISSLHSQLMDRPGFTNSIESKRLIDYAGEHGWY